MSSNSSNLETNTVAPDFELPTNMDGKSFRLSDYRGKKVVIYFYPKDNTPGCTLETMAFRDDYEKFKSLNTEIVGISKDSVEKHKKFAEKLSIPFLLASDENSDVCEKYDVWKQKSMFGKKYMGIERSTFLIDEEGKISKIWRKVKVKGHSKEVLDACQGN